MGEIWFATDSEGGLVGAVRKRINQDNVQSEKNYDTILPLADWTGTE